ncbi:hypothetical protein [Streptomyces sp. NPDC049879]|uniref:hypothetical protein n=1 Tax=Streptomyces sp. NPDC049879 TaxID=3365598 RepID=UPI0037B5BBEA
MSSRPELRTIRMRPVPGVGQACRIVALPGDGDVVLEGPADVLDGVRLARLVDPPDFPEARPRGMSAAEAGATLDWVRVQVQARFGGPT